jgi:hypothetical protein
VTGYTASFKARLIKWSGPSAWHFAVVPEKHAPLATHAWGRTPVVAVVDGTEWKTSVWKEKTGRTLLAVPKRVRGEKTDGDPVSVKLTFSGL